MKKYEINFSRLINTELYQFLSLMLKAAKDADPVVSKIKPEYDIMDAVLVRMLAAINREKASELTKEIEKLDARRDTAISGFVAWVKVYSKYPKLVKREPAVILNNYLSNHGTGIATLNLQAETAVLTKIVDDCKTQQNLITALATLDGKDWIDEIEETNLAFINTYAKRSEELGEEGNKESFYDVRKEALPAYYALVDMIISRYKTAAADKLDITLLQKCVDQIDATITQYRQLIKATQPIKKDTPPAK